MMIYIIDNIQQIIIREEQPILIIMNIDRMQILNKYICYHESQFLPSGLQNFSIVGMNRILKQKNRKNKQKHAQFIKTKGILNIQYQPNISMNNIKNYIKTEYPVDTPQYLTTQTNKNEGISYNHQQNQSQYIQQLINSFIQLGFDQDPSISTTHNTVNNNTEHKNIYQKISVIFKQSYHKLGANSLEQVYIEVINQTKKFSSYLARILNHNIRKIFNAQTSDKALFYLCLQTILLLRQPHIVIKNRHQKMFKINILLLNQILTDNLTEAFFRSDNEINHNLFQCVQKYYSFFDFNQVVNFSQLQNLSNKISQIGETADINEQIMLILTMIDPLVCFQKIMQSIEFMRRQTDSNLLLIYILRASLFWLGINLQNSSHKQEWQLQKKAIFTKVVNNFIHEAKINMSLIKESLIFFPFYITNFTNSNQQFILVLLFFQCNPHTNQIYHQLSNHHQYKSIDNHQLSNHHQYKSIDQILLNNLLLTPQKLKNQNYLLSFIPFVLKQSFRAQILSSDKDLIQNIDWEYISKLIDNQQRFRQLLSSTTFLAIKKYRNAEKYISLDLPLELKTDQFQIKVVIQGLLQVITQGQQITQADKSLYFRVISILRSSSIPKYLVYPLYFMQLLFQWFILRQSIFRRDIKSIGVSLSFLLQQGFEKELNSSFSMRITQSMQMKTSKLHNCQALQKMWSADLLKWIFGQNKEEKWEYYKGFLECICTAILVVKKMQQKIIKSSKIQKWIELIAAKLIFVQNITENRFKSDFKDYRKMLLQKILY